MPSQLRAPPQARPRLARCYAASWAAIYEITGLLTLPNDDDCDMLLRALGLMFQPAPPLVHYRSERLPEAIY